MSVLTRACADPFLVCAADLIAINSVMSFIWAQYRILIIAQVIPKERQDPAGYNELSPGPFDPLFSDFQIQYSAYYVDFINTYPAAVDINNEGTNEASKGRIDKKSVGGGTHTDR